MNALRITYLQLNETYDINIYMSKYLKELIKIIYVMFISYFQLILIISLSKQFMKILYA